MADSSFSRLGRSLRTRFLSPVSDDASLDSQPPFSREHMQRAAIYAERWAYYRSVQRPPLRVKPGQKDTNVIENYTRQIINDTVYFLFGDGELSFEIGNLEAAQTPKEEEILYDFWKPGARWSPATFLEKVGQSGAITGQPFVRLYTIGDEIRLTPLDAGLVDVKTADENIDDVHEYCVYWQAGSDWKRHRVTLQDSGLAWDIVTEKHGGGKWTEEETLPWPYEFPPIFHCQNLPLAHSFYGMSDIEEAALNDSINEVTTDMRKTNHYYSAPTTIAKGVSPTQMKRDMIRSETGSIITIPQTDADIFNLEMQSDLASSASLRQSLVDTYHTVTDSVRLDPNLTSFGAMSGFAIQLLYMPLLAKTARKRNTYGSMLAQINSAVLQLRGVAEPPLVKTIWPSSLPENKLEMAQVAAQLATFGDLRGALSFAGFTLDEIEAIAADVDRLSMVEQ